MNDVRSEQVANPVAQIRHVRDGEQQYDAITFNCPGCSLWGETNGFHLLPVNSTVKSPSWDWNGDLTAVTLAPSILTRMPGIDGGPAYVCHSFLRDGVFEFLGDCTHALAGQRVPMVPLLDWMVRGDGEDS